MSYWVVVFPLVAAKPTNPCMIVSAFYNSGITVSFPTSSSYIAIPWLGLVVFLIQLCRTQVAFTILTTISGSRYIIIMKIWNLLAKISKVFPTIGLAQPFPKALIFFSRVRLDHVLKRRCFLVVVFIWRSVTSIMKKKKSYHQSDCHGCPHLCRWNYNFRPLKEAVLYRNIVYSCSTANQSLRAFSINVLSNNSANKMWEVTLTIFSRSDLTFDALKKKKKKSIPSYYTHNIIKMYKVKIS